MRKSRFAEEQMVEILREADRTSVAAAAKKNKVSEQTIYVWRQHFAGLEPSDVRKRQTSSHPPTRLSRQGRKPGRGETESWPRFTTARPDGATATSATPVSGCARVRTNFLALSIGIRLALDLRLRHGLRTTWRDTLTVVQPHEQRLTPGLQHG